MFDFIQLLYDLRHKPVSFVVIAGIIFIIDRVGRTFITSQVRRLFHVDEQYNFKQYATNQKIIMDNQIKIMERMGIEPCGNKPIYEQSKTHTRMNLKTLLILLWIESRRRIKRMNINKVILLPIISAIALIIKQYSGYELTNEEINAYADIILFAISIAGIFITPTKKEGKPKDVELDFTDSPNA